MESGIRARTGVSIIGVWDHGRLVSGQPGQVIGRQTVLVLAGTKEHITRYTATFGRKPDQ